MVRTLIIATLLVIVLPTLGACAPASNVQFTYIFYDDLVFRVESDGYVEITNLGAQSQDLTGWALKDISEELPSFIFHSSILSSSKNIRVHTNESHPERREFNFEYGQAI